MSDEKVVSLKVVPPAALAVNADAIEMIEGVLEELRSGAATAVAFVVVKADGCVATAWSKSQSYHLLTSGAATLLTRIASS